MARNFIVPGLPVVNQKQPGIKDRLRDFFLIKKMNTPLGYLMLLLICVAIGVGIAKAGIVVGALVLAIVLGIPVIYSLVAYPRVGITLFLTFAYLIMWVIRMGIINFPLGTLMDGMEGLFILNLFIQQKRNPDWKIFKSPISTMILIWIGYNLLELANPVAASRLAWVFTVRTVAFVMVMYFIFMYNIRTKEFIRFILKLWLALAFFGALYATKQQYIGFFQFEETYLHRDPNIELLLFIGGVWRKFSIFADPVVFAYTMAVSSLLCIGLMTGPLPKKKKIVLFLLMCFYISAMLYSGTRGAFVLVPAAMLLYAILKFNTKILLFAIVAAAMLAVLVFMPTSNGTLYRFQSAFKPSNDASYTVRKINQKRIQPFIQSHPLGGGLGSTGDWGKQFSPGTMLAAFPPDSGYVRVAVEMGWMGLFLLCLLMFTVLKTGINNYYSIKDPELRSWCFAMVLIVFAFHIANFPQEALVQYPSNVYFYLVLALIGITKRLDNQQNGIA